MRNFSFNIWIYLAVLLSTAQFVSANPILNFFNQSIPDLVLKTIHENINGSLRAKQITFSPPSSLTFHQLSLKDEKQTSILDIKKATVNLSLLSLFVGKIKADSIVAESPHIHLVTENGELNLAKIFSKIKTKKTDTSLSFIDLNHIEIINGDLNWKNEKDPPLSFHQIASTGYIKIAPSGVKIHVNTLKSKQANLFFDQKNWDIQSLFLKNSSYQNQTLKIDHLTAQIFDTPIQLKGNIRFQKEKFFLKLQTGPLKIFELPIQQSSLDLEIRSQQITLHKGNIQLNDQALIFAQGTFDLTSRTLHVSSKIQQIPWENLKKAFNIDFKASAYLSGQVEVTGVLAENHSLRIQAKTHIKDLSTDYMQLPSSMLSLHLLLRPHKNLEFIETTLDADQLKLDVSGNIDLETKTLALSFQTTVAEPHLLYNQIPKDIVAKGLQAKGQLSGSIKDPIFQAGLQLNAFQKDVTVGKKLSASLYINTDTIAFKNINGTLANGYVHGNLSFDKKNEKITRGTFSLSEASLSQIPLPVSLRSRISGDINAQINLQGTWKQPHIQASTQLSNAYVEKIFFQKMKANLGYRNHQMQFRELDARMPYGNISAPLITIDFLKKSLQGLLIIHQLSLEGIPHLNPYKLTGNASGSLEIGKDFDQPEIQGYLQLENITWKKQIIGNGKTFVWYHPNQTPFLQLSGELSQEDALIQYRSTIDLPHQKIRAEVKLKDISFLPWTSLPSSFLMPLQAKVSGNLQVDGSLTLPHVKAQLQTPNIQYQENITSDAKIPVLKKQWVSAGPAVLSAQMKDGFLNASLCGFPENSSMELCSTDNRINLSINGFFASMHDYDLKIDGAVRLEKIEQWIRLIKKEFNSIDTHFQIHTQLTQKKHQNKLLFKGQIEFLSLHAVLPGLEPILLKNKTQINFHNHGIELPSPVLLALATGQLSIKGSASKARLSLDFSGRIPLILTKYLVPFFTLADGLATGALKIRGSAQHPLLDGYLIPDKGAFIKPSMILDDIVFNSGAVYFSSQQQQKTFSILFDHVDMAVGDGHAHLNGEARLNTQYHPNSHQFASWDLELSGEEILLRNQRDWIETNLDVILRTVDKKDTLFGKINITDGYLFKKFAFKNFVLSSEAPGKFYLPNWLWPARVNLQIGVSSFHLQTQMSAFLIDSSLAANLDLIGTLAAPRLVGAVDIVEGIFKFPLLYFEIPPSSIPFKNTPGRFIDPQVRILAYADLPQKRFNLSEDTSLELSLTGNLEQMKLDIKTLSGDKTFDRSRLLFLLIGASNGGTDLLEDMLSSYTGTRILIGSAVQTEGVATQLQWQLNSRLEFEGTAKTTVTNVDLQDLKLNLMIFDHLPFGHQLFLESVLFSPATDGSDSSTRENFRLKFRVLEQ